MHNDFQAILHNERKQILNLMRSTQFTRLTNDLIHQQIIPFASYAPWETDEGFKQVFNDITGHTLIDKYRCYELWELAKQAAPLKGDVIEVGVWKGGTGSVIAKGSEGNSDSTVFLCDTFEGVVKVGDNDTIYKGGEHADTSEEIVNELLKKINAKNVTILNGIFPDDFMKEMDGKSFKFCHIDVDTYGSAKDIFDFVWPRMVAGGVVIFDDFGFWGCEGVTKLVNEIHVPGGFKVYNLNGHGLIIKYAV
jgi:O-methyltransferase